MTRNIWQEHRSKLWVWISFMGGMAADRTRYWGHFLETTKDVLWRNDLVKGKNVEILLRSFLWPDSACREGAYILWEALQVDAGVVGVL
jgi:hypothetical protein